MTTVNLPKPTMKLDECVRWLYRHQGILDFSRSDEDEDVISVAVPLRSPEGEMGKTWAITRTQEEAVEKFVRMVGFLSEEFYLE